MIAISPIDFRAGINRLISIAQTLFEKDTSAAYIFVFKNKKSTDIKLILYDTNGYLLAHKRLSKGKLKWWPRTSFEAENIDTFELVRLLDGVDPRGSFHPDWDDLTLKNASCVAKKDTKTRAQRKRD